MFTDLRVVNLFILFAIGLTSLCVDGENITANPVENINATKKDMYVINEVVYTVGIITNKTDGELTNTTATDQEAVTIFKSNGSSLDLGGLSAPLETDVSAQSLVGVAPAQKDKQIPWTELEKIASLPSQSGLADKPRKPRYATAGDEPHLKSFISLFKRSLNETQKFFNHTQLIPVKIVKGDAAVPDQAGIKSILIPPLISFNNNLSDIPVPIPNTSEVHYAKVDTMVHMI